MKVDYSSPDVIKALEYLEDIKDLKKSNSQGTAETNELIVDDPIYYTAIRSHVKYWLKGRNHTDEIAWEIFKSWNKKRLEGSKAIAEARQCQD